MIDLSKSFNINVMIFGKANPMVNIYPEYGLTTDDIREIIRESGMIPDVPDRGEETPSGCIFHAYYSGTERPGAIHAALVDAVYNHISTKKRKKQAYRGDLRVVSKWYSIAPDYEFDN